MQQDLDQVLKPKWPKDQNRSGPNKNFLDCVQVEVIGRPTTNIQSRHKAPRCTPLIPLKLLSIPFCSILLPFTSPPQIDNRSYLFILFYFLFFINAFKLVSSSYSLFIIIIFFLMLLFASHMTGLDLSNWLDLIGLPCSFTLPL